jgi:radical SAM protein with 4Fe4S-binding SPASM domain
MLFLRREFFGCVVYDNGKKQYYFFDQEAFETLLKLKASGTTNHQDKGESGPGVESVVRWLRQHGLMDQLASMHICPSTPADGCLSAPLQVYYDVTYGCPNRCRHCFTSSGARSPDELSLSEAADFIEQMQAAGTYRLSLAGGEPFVREDIFDIISHARLHNIDVSLTTSGLIITDEIARRIEQADLKTLTVSFDGGSVESFEYVRGTGSYGRVVEAIRLLRRRFSGRLAVRMTLVQPNYLEIPQVCQIAVQLGVDVVKVNPARPLGRAAQHKDLVLTPKQFQESVRLGLSLLGRTDVSLVLPSSPNYNPAPSLWHSLSEARFPFLGFGCVGGLTTVNLDPVGTLSPCGFLASYFSGLSVRQHRLVDIWIRGPGFIDRRQLRFVSTCMDRPCYTNCEGGCRARALAATGVPDGPDPYCEFLGTQGLVS